jgi:hypothetical protein
VAGWFTMQAGSNGYQWRDSANGATAQMVLNSSGNLGLGVTPSAWNTSYKALQVGTSAVLWSTGTGGARLGVNYFLNSADSLRYIGSNVATDYRQSNGEHQFFNAPSGTAGNAITFTQAMTLDASGNLGIGTTSPGQKLDVNGSINVSSAGNIFTASSSGIFFNGSGSYSTGIYNNASGSLLFDTNGSNRARIDSSGNLLVGVTSVTAGSGTTVSNANSSTWSFRVQSTAATSPNSILAKFTAASPNNAGNDFLYCEDGGFTLRARIYSNGGLGNYSANNVNLSDRREKTNFAPATSYLDKICAIPVQTFNYIDQNLEEDDGLTLGVVAQDVQAVAPELVMESNWASKDDEPKMRLSIYQTDLQYALMKCIQEQQALIQSLKARLDAANL